jgi:hypothetical protein
MINRNLSKRVKGNTLPKFITLLLLVLISNLVSAQNAEDKLGSWYIYNGFFKLTPQFEVFFESQLRTYEMVSNPETFFLRPYFTYNLNKNVQPGLGLEYHKSWTYSDIPEDKVVSEEFRITLQTMVFQSIDRVRLQHRYRYEFRTVNENKLQRMRYRIQATIPLNGTTMTKGTLFTNVFNEIMIDTEPEFNFSQNRVYLSGGYQFSDNLNLQLGYMAVFRKGSVLNRLQFFLTQKFWFYDSE